MIPDAALTQTYFDAVISSVIVDIPEAKQLAWNKHPLNEAERERVRLRVMDAVLKAIDEPGVVLRISCDWPSEVIWSSMLLKGVLPMLKNVELLTEQSTSSRFELDNNSAILVVLGKLPHEVDASAIENAANLPR